MEIEKLNDCRSYLVRNTPHKKTKQFFGKKIYVLNCVVGQKQFSHHSCLLPQALRRTVLLQDDLQLTTVKYEAVFLQ